MKRSFLAIALLACAALASVCFHAVADPVIAACQRFKNIVLYGFKLAEIEPVNSTRPAKQRVRAKSFLAGIMKRERPVVTGSWRMCPST